MTLNQCHRGESVVKSQANRGFTILELIITVAVLVILATVALPNLRATLQNNRMTAQANQFLTAFQYARSEAIKRREPVSICPSSDGENCTGNWEDGWIVFVDDKKAGETTTDVPDAGALRIWQGMEGGTSNAGDDPDFIRYLASGAVDINAGTSFPVTFKLEIPDCKSDSNRNLEIGPTGQASVSRVACN